MADQAETPDRDAAYWQRKISLALLGTSMPVAEPVMRYARELVVLARAADGCRVSEPVGLASALSARREEIARSLVANTEPVASELDVEMAEMQEELRVLHRGAPAPEGDRRSAPPPSAHGGAPPVIPPAGVYGNRVLESATIAPWPSPPKVGVFNSKTGSTWFSVEGTVSFDRTMADENWTFMGWLELRSVPSA